MNFLRKRFLIYIILFFTIMIVFVYFYANTPTQYAVVESDFKLEISDTISLVSGKRLAMTICAHCHYNHEYGTLAGRKHGNPTKFGSFYSGNITNDSIDGIGSWSEEELYYLLRTGIKKNGEYVFDMPKYPNLTEEDIKSLIAFLKSSDELVKPTAYKNPEPQFSFITKVLLKFWFKPETWKPGFYPNSIDKKDMIALGKYLSTAMFSCFDCHSGNALLNNYEFPERSWRYFKGDNPHVNQQGELVKSQALIPISTIYTIDEFVRTLKTGYRVDGTMLEDPMIPFSVLSDNEIKAIYLYLKSLEN